MAVFTSSPLTGSGAAVRDGRVSEELFTLTKTSAVTRRPPAHCSSPEIAFAKRCADIDLILDGDKFGGGRSISGI